jgi:hypothetical protein
VIKVQPLDSEYWDSKHGKMASMLKVVSTLVESDGGNGEQEKLTMN